MGGDRGGYHGIDKGWVFRLSCWCIRVPVTFSLDVFAATLTQRKPIDCLGSNFVSLFMRIAIRQAESFIHSSNNPVDVWQGRWDHIVCGAVFQYLLYFERNFGAEGLLFFLLISPQLSGSWSRYH